MMRTNNLYICPLIGIHVTIFSFESSSVKFIVRSNVIHHKKTTHLVTDPQISSPTVNLRYPSLLVIEAEKCQSQAITRDPFTTTHFSFF